MVNRADYSDEQLEAWAAGVHDPEEWHARMTGRRTLVAEEGGEVVGFAELEAAAFMATFASILIFEVGDQGRGLIAWFFTCPLAFIHRPAKRSLRGKHRGVKQAGVTEALF